MEKTILKQVNGNKWLVKRILALTLVLITLISCLGTVNTTQILGQNPSVAYATHDGEPTTEPNGEFVIPLGVTRDMLFATPSDSDNDFEAGVLYVGFDRPYFGAALNEQFAGLDIVRIEDIKLSQYESMIPLTNMESLNQDIVQDTLNYVRRKIGMEYQITLAQETKESVWDSIQILKRNTNVAYATPCFIIKHAGTPDDPYFTNGSLWGMEKIQAPEAWKIATGSHSVKVGIVDTGIDYTHPDLQANIDLTYAYNVPLGANIDVMDYDGRGTHVAGIVGAEGDNGMGVVGVNWNVSLVPIKIAKSNTDPTPNKLEKITLFTVI